MQVSTILCFLCAQPFNGLLDFSVFQGKNVEAVVPDRPLADHSIAIQSKEARPLLLWKKEDHCEAFVAIKKVVQVWKNSGLAQDYLVYGKENGSRFSWQVVPFKKEFNFWDHFKVLWNVTFGPSKQTELLKKAQANDFRLREQSPELILPKLEVPDDPFCNPEVIERQRVFEGKTVDILYNYAPYVFGKEKLHFMVVTKQHRARFTDLTGEEYLEAAEKTEQLVKHFRQKGFNTAYIFHRTGKGAGQSVPHWHQHVVFTANQGEELMGKLKILKTMLWGNSPMPPHELKAKVCGLRAELSSLH